MSDQKMAPEAVEDVKSQPLALVNKAKGQLDQLSVAYTEWHDIRTGEKDEKYFKIAQSRIET